MVYLFLQIQIRLIINRRIGKSILWINGHGFDPESEYVSFRISICKKCIGKIQLCVKIRSIISDQYFKTDIEDYI